MFLMSENYSNYVQRIVLWCIHNAQKTRLPTFFTELYENGRKDTFSACKFCLLANKSWLITVIPFRCEVYHCV